MINLLELEDWESHKITTLSLSYGTNVIVGLSHSGKSSIIRALNMLINNQPSGTAYFPRGKKKPSTTIAAELGEDFVVRIRTKDKNEYETPDGVFTALRTGVPNQVDQILNMSDVNLQLQKDVHFMLTESPGKRAKRLNAIAGLEEMDTAMDTINSMFRSIKKEHDAELLNMENLSTQRTALSWVDEADARTEELDSTVQTISAVKVKMCRIQKLVDKIEEAEETLSKFPDFTALSLIYKIYSAEDALASIEGKMLVLGNRLKSISEQQTALTNINLPTKEQSSNFDAIKARIEGVKSKLHSLATKIDKEDYAAKELAVVQHEKDKAEKAVTELWQSATICPLCKRDL